MGSWKLESTAAPELQEGALEEARQTVKKECLEGETEKTKEFCWYQSPPKKLIGTLWLLDPAGEMGLKKQELLE